MAVQTSSNVGLVYKQPHPSIFRDIQSAGHAPLPPGLSEPNCTAPREYYTTTTQHNQKPILEYPHKKQPRYAKAPSHVEIQYMKDFCEKLLRQPHSNGQSPESESLRQYNVKIAHDKEIFSVPEKNWKGKDITQSDNLFDPIANYKRELKSLAGDDGIERILDPYLTISQNDFRYYHPKVLNEGIGKRDAITIYSEISERMPKENEINLDKIGKPSRFLGRNIPCAVDEKRRADTFPWPSYVTRHHLKFPAAKSEHQSSFTAKVLKNYDLDDEFRRNIPKIESPVGFDERFTVPNMYRTESSYIGSGEILAVPK